MDEAARTSYLKDLETTSILPRIIVTGYKTLQLIYYFTAGHDEVRAWTIRVRILSGERNFYGGKWCCCITDYLVMVGGWSIVNYHIDTMLVYIYPLF